MHLSLKSSGMFCHVIWHNTFNNTAVRNQYLDIILLHHMILLYYIIDSLYVKSTYAIKLAKRGYLF